LLPLVGATHEKRRVVRHGNLITAGGVTSGIDFGLEVVADIAGEAVARSIQLSLEYDPISAVRFRASRSRRSADAC
jgi:cyclohexyl-isocyanide hydratase